MTTTQVGKSKEGGGVVGSGKKHEKVDATMPE